MMKNKVSLQHIHIVAENKYELAKWYEEKLGFKIIDDIEKLGEKEGPLFISADEGKTAISIFDRQKRHKSIGTNCIPAFELHPDDFISLYKKMKSNDNELKVYDHHIFFSFYTKDPSETLVELTSLKYEQVKEQLALQKIETLAMNPAAE